jgi:hypothetical protein
LLGINLVNQLLNQFLALGLNNDLAETLVVLREQSAGLLQSSLNLGLSSLAGNVLLGEGDKALASSADELVLLGLGGEESRSAELKKSANLGRWVLLLQQVNDLRKVSVNKVVALSSEGRGQETTGLLDLLFDLGSRLVLADKVLSSAYKEGAKSALDIILGLLSLDGLNNLLGLSNNRVVGAELEVLADDLRSSFGQEGLNDLVSVEEDQSVAGLLEVGRQVSACLNKSLLNFGLRLVYVLFSVGDSSKANTAKVVLFLGCNDGEDAESSAEEEQSLEHVCVVLRRMLCSAWNTIMKLKVPEIPKGIPSEKEP